jgi:hypothetical protein
MLNNPSSKAAYAALWGALSPAQLADLFELIMNARKAFLGEKIVAARVDVAAAYNRILNIVGYVPSVLLVLNGRQKSCCYSHRAHARYPGLQLRVRRVE